MEDKSLYRSSSLYLQCLKVQMQVFRRAPGGRSFCVASAPEIPLQWCDCWCHIVSADESQQGTPLPKSVFSDIQLGSLKLVTVGVFTSQRMANATNQGFFFFLLKASCWTFTNTSLLHALTHSPVIHLSWPSTCRAECTRTHSLEHSRSISLLINKR